MNPGPPEPTPFTQADLAAYDAELQQGLALSGEDKTYFARGRLAWLAGQLPARGLPTPRRILDYGCGGGDTTLQLARQWPAARVVGCDPSETLIAAARRADHAGRCEFLPPAALPRGEPPFDLVYCNGVFHHIPAAEQPAALAWIHARLAPAGIFSLWENNSWSPAARWVMSRIPFDRDAVMLAPPPRPPPAPTGRIRRPVVRFPVLLPALAPVAPPAGAPAAQPALRRAVPGPVPARRQP